ncbi:MAG: DUF488 domain-containing protein [Anaerolineales bacterium]|nr:DUF488 domain-containing protein [Anaerolineales bacterium]MBX3036723.1 DUF488 domain-containing protein [Anaerolineales bacterium]
MYYRRKILLALIEVFGGSLKSTDCEKLLFNFCQQTGKNHYEFFPHKFGPFSNMSYYDKRILVSSKLLKPVDDFQLSTKHSYLKELTQADKAALLRFKSNIGNLRGDSLVKKTYREFPQYTLRSKIAGKHFSDEELKQRQFAFAIETNPAVFSIGYEGLTIDSFLYKLIVNNISVVVDVRNNPQSMKYGFSKKSFKQYIENAGMKYIHIPELGIPSAMRKGLGESVSHKALFKSYENKLLPKQETEINQLIDLTNKNERIALVCFESDHQFCHRHTLIEHLQKNSSFKRKVIHL